MKVEKVDAVNLDEVHRIMRSKQISNTQKEQFIKDNKTHIDNISEFQISSPEYNKIMESRHLRKFRPIKNSFTKAGDKIILAKSLGIKPSEVAGYIKKISGDIEEINDLTFLPDDKIEQMKTYVFRHGSKDELVNFLDYELMKTKDIVGTLYTTLEYHTGGVADYFIRPIHRLDNNTMVRIYNVIDKNLDRAYKAGDIDKIENDKISRAALMRIYQIQNNNKFINAVKTAKVLNG
ncbi:hypothetical protein IJI31_02580 [bacterium]|nr:hypothetical protein [bacterium]